MVETVSFSRPAASGTGQNTALINALLNQALTPQRTASPAQGLNGLGQTALAELLRAKKDQKKPAGPGPLPNPTGFAESFSAPLNGLLGL